MAVRARKIHVIQTVEELNALKNPTRFRLLNLLQKLGEASVAILAGRVEMKAESLYYHMHVLKSAGLIEVARERVTGRRPETIYAPAAPHFRIDPKNRDRDFLKALLAVYRSQLRYAERNLEAALMAEAEGSGTRSNTHARQYDVALRPFKAERLKRLIGTLDDYVMESDDPSGEEHYTLTILLTRTDSR